MLSGIIALVIFAIFLALGVPIAWGLFIASFIGIVPIVGIQGTIGIVAPLSLFYVAEFAFAVVPLFILMGQLAYYSGILSEVFDVARKWLGRLPGGLAVSVVGANTIFGAASGSTIAACVVIGQSAIPEMRKHGYSDAMATGVVAAAGNLASLIPPSVNMVLYGILVGQSVGKLLIGGVFPGLVTATVFIIFIMAFSRVPKVQERYTWKEKIYAVRFLWLIGVTIAAVIGSMYFGIATPTEAGAAGAFVIALLALAKRQLNLHVLWESVKSTLATTSMVYITIIAAVLLSRLLSLSGITDAVLNAVSATMLPRAVIFIIITLIYLLLGCFICGIGMLALTLPTIYPLMMSLGYDPIWFGIIAVIYMELAQITPPVGLNLFALKGVAPDVPLMTVARGSAPFVIMILATVAILYIFPQIVTWLPEHMLQ